MFSTPDPLLFLEESRMRHIDTQNPSALFSMWSAFSKASGIMEQGQRFEHMSWRLWAHQSLCERRRRKQRGIVTKESHSNIPQLSSSVESTSSVDSLPLHTLDDSSFQADDITPENLEHLVTSIKNKQDLVGPICPLPPRKPHASESTSTPRPSSPLFVPMELSASTVGSTSTDATRISPTSSSDTSEESVASDHNVVRGFTPGSMSTYKSQTHLIPSPAPILKQSGQERAVTRKAAKFHFGSVGSGSDNSTLQDNMSPTSINEIGSLPSSRKQTSFKAEVIEIPRKTFELADDDDEAVIDDSEDDSPVSESAIEDDDDAWEDEGESDDVPRELTFPRVDSKAQLTSRRSAIWDQLHGHAEIAPPRSASAAQLRRSRTSTPVGPSMPASPDESTMHFAGSPPHPHSITIHPPCPPMSERETRRNMLTQELNNSLRKHMLNERQQRHFFAGLQRRAQTSVDMRQLAVDTRPRNSSPHSQNSSNNAWNDYYDDAGSYHQAGW